MSTDQKYKCSKCEIEKNLDELDIWHSKNSVTYECINRKICNTAFDTNKKISSNENNNNTKNIEDTLKEKYNFEMNTLEEINHRFRDASVHYFHKETRDIYSWSIITKSWYKPNDTVKEQIKKYIKDEADK